VLISSYRRRQPIDDVIHNPSSRLPLFSARSTATFPVSEHHRPWLLTIILLGLGECLMNKGTCVWMTCSESVSDSGTERNRTSDSKWLVQCPAYYVVMTYRIQQMHSETSSKLDWYKRWLVKIVRQGSIVLQQQKCNGWYGRHKSYAIISENSTALSVTSFLLPVLPAYMYCIPISGI